MLGDPQSVTSAGEGGGGARLHGTARPPQAQHTPTLSFPFPQHTQCFEGMKAYKDVHGHLRLFRPDLNTERLNSSLARLYMPVRLLSKGIDGSDT